jgi:hypothetical protein
MFPHLQTINKLKADVFVFCVHEAPFLQVGHTYRLIRFDANTPHFPYGLKLIDGAGTELPDAYPMQLFDYFFLSAN